MSNKIRGVKVPSSLGAAGRKLWAETLSAYSLSQHEKDLLLQACATLDLINTLQRRIGREGVVSEGYKGQPVAHPLLNELRQNRDLFGRLIGRLALPDAETGAHHSDSNGLQSVDSLQQRTAGLSRWAKAHG